MVATTETLNFVSAKVYKGNQNSEKEKYPVLNTSIRSKHPRDYTLINGVGFAKT